MKCYACNCRLSPDRDTCPKCGADIRLYRKIIYASNQYYNLGLARAKARDLTGAAECLRTSLQLYKKNISARNLLGLVYYEMGEAALALKEWVISKNLRHRGNIADDYIRDMRDNRQSLDSADHSIRKFNQALEYAKTGSKDMAVIQLKKVINVNPRMIKAYQLLALLYLQDNKLELAKKTLRNAGKIDTNNTTTLRYLREVNARLKEKSPSKKPKDDDLISYQSGNETIIMPKRFKESSIGATLVYIVIGLIVGTAITAFLIVPSVRNKAKEEAQRKLVEASDTISTNGQTIKDLEGQVEDLKNQLEEQTTNNEKVKVKISTYENLLQACVSYYGSKDVTTAGETLDKVKTKYLSDKAKTIYDDINGEVQDKYLNQLYKEGYSLYSRGKYKDAIDTLKQITDEQEDFQDGSAAYYLAQSYRKNGDLKSAKPYYQYVIENYPDTERARTSQNYVDAQE